MNKVKEIAERKGNRPRVRNLIAFSALIMLLFCIIVGIQATRSYDRAIAEGKQNAERLASIVSDHAELTFLAADLALRRATERQYFNLLFGGNLPQYMEHNFHMWVEETPQIAAMMMTDAEGNVEVAAHKKGYDKWVDYRYKVGNEKIFQLLKEGSDYTLFVGPHYMKDPDHPNLVILGRRMSKLDGDFGGIVVVALDASYFVDFFNSVEKGSKRFMALTLAADNTVLVSGPSELEPNRPLLEEEIKHPPTNTMMTGMRTVEDSIKIYSYKTLSHLPIAIMVALDESDFLHGWRQARVKDIGFLAIFTVFGSVLSFFALTMAKQIMYVEESEAAAVLASQAKSEFLANMSHELRTPLNAIIGFSEMMSSGYFGPLNAKQRERIHDINLCGSHLLQLISDILDFSKGEAGKLELVEENVDMEEIVREGVRMMNEKAKSKSITIIIDADPSLPRLWADKRKIRQILINLLSNAIKFTPEGGQVKVIVKLDQHDNLNLIVSDTGIGIAEEDISTALSVFGQVHRGQSHEGTGLGLPLCKMFAELHGGKMALTSVVGEGTTVRIIFPAQRVVSRE